MSDHYTIDFLPDEQDWWRAHCKCGLDLGDFPDAEAAADALMEHAYEQGVADAAERARAGEWR